MGSFAIALYDALLSAGVATDRARAVVDLFDRSVDERYGLYMQFLATKTDLAAMATKSDLAVFATKADLTAFATKADLAAMATKTDLAAMATKTDLAAMATKIDLAAMATKTDLAELRAKVAEDVGGLRKETAETNVRVAKLETRIAETKSDLIKWMLAALTAQTALLLALKLV